MTILPDSVALALPEEWEDIPLEASEYRQFIEQQLAGLKEAGFDDRADLRQFEVLAELGYELAQRARVMMASSLVAVMEGSNEDDEAVMLMANLVVSGFLREELDTDVPLRAEIVAESFSQRVPIDDDRVRHDHIEPPSVCEIGGLKSAKLVRLMSLPPERGGDLKQFTQTYLVSVAEGDAVIVLQFSTMNFELAREFSELFETIAQTLRILYPDDPTFLDEVDADGGSGMDAAATVSHEHEATNDGG
ncbi:MAG: hypothetical protein OXC06_19515 [Acidimicrobiaceae bacterium]|nr:hypothetical protein [Acidimicrobiaceae bacterium]